MLTHELDGAKKANAYALSCLTEDNKKMRYSIQTQNTYCGMKGKDLRELLAKSVYLENLLQKTNEKYADCYFIQASIVHIRTVTQDYDQAIANIEYVIRLYEHLQENGLTDIFFHHHLAAFAAAKNYKEKDFERLVRSVCITQCLNGGTPILASGNALKRFDEAQNLWSMMDEVFDVPAFANISRVATPIMTSLRRGNDGEFAHIQKEHRKYKKKLQKAYELMRSKGWIHDFHTFDMTNPDYAQLSKHYSYLIPLKAITDIEITDTIIGLDPIGENEWLEALELVLYIENPELIRSVRECKEELKKHADVLEQISSKVCIMAYLIFIIRKLSSPDMLEHYYKISLGGDYRTDEFKALEESARSSEASLKKVEAENEALKTQLKAMQKMITQTPDLSKHVSEMNHLHNKEIREKDQQIEQLMARVAQLEEAQAKNDQELMRVTESSMNDKPWLDIELPETGVVFVGGHPNMVKKIAYKHPKWTFIADNISAGLPPKAEVIFLWTNHLSHPLWYRINEFYHGRESFCYLTATNIDRLYEEMRFNLWKTRV